MSLAPTPSQTVGPFFSLGLCAVPVNELVEAQRAGAVRIAGRVLDGAGEAVPDALVEIWQADEDGEYRADFGWGRCGTDEEGRYSFTTVKPGSAGGQAPHLSMLVFARGLLKAVCTRMYFPDEEEANDRDPVLRCVPESERATLVAAQDGEALRFDIQLQGSDQTAFFAL
jgi:protocatechuate 3,4-dioxygenase alpha subunit